MQKKIVRGAKQVIEQFKNDIEASEHSIALKEKEFVIPPLFKTKDL